MKTRCIIVLSFISLSFAACSSGTTNQSGTTPTPAIQPPVVTSPPTQVVKPDPQTSPSPATLGQTTQPPSESKPTPITGAKTAEVQVNGLNVRSLPSTNSQIRGTLPKGTQAKIIQSQGSWYYIVMGRVEGWVEGSYVKVLDGNPGNAVSKPSPVTEAKTAEVIVNDLNVRSLPDTTSQVRGTLPKGTQAKIIQQQGSWYYIVMGRVEGWVSGTYLKVLDGNPGSTTNRS